MDYTEYTAPKMKILAEDYHEHLNEQGIDYFLTQIKKMAYLGKLYVDFQVIFSQEQVAKLKELGYQIQEKIRGPEPIFRISWE